MLACHGILAGACAGAFRPTSGRSRRRWYRVFNEVPTLLFIGIVLLAVLKPCEPEISLTRRLPRGPSTSDAMTKSTDDIPGHAANRWRGIIPAAAPPPRRRRGTAARKRCGQASARRRRTATRGHPTAGRPPEQTTLRLIEEAVPVPRRSRSPIRSRSPSVQSAASGCEPQPRDAGPPRAAAADSRDAQPQTVVARPSSAPTQYLATAAATRRSRRSVSRCLPSTSPS